MIPRGDETRLHVLTLGQLGEACDGEIANGASELIIRGVAIDSRRVVPHDLFVCLRGQRVDGHAYVQAACDAGAAAILAEHGVSLTLETDVPVLRVADAVLALGKIARAWHRTLGTVVIGVTGSSGKTSTKEMLAAYLGQFYCVTRTEGNQNNELGVPLSLLALRPHHELAIIEMGMRGLGQIAYLADLAEPTIGVITNIGLAHVELLGSQANIARAKAELWTHLKSEGIAVVPWDDHLARAAVQTWGRLFVSWSLGDSDATVWASDVSAVGEGQCFVAHWRGFGACSAAGSAVVQLPLWGDHHRGNALAALATGLALGLTPPSTLTLTPSVMAGRSRWVRFGTVSVMDETYNANPDSMRQAIRAFMASPCEGRRVLVLGDMAELGAMTEQAHHELGAWLKGQEIPLVLACGTWARLYLASGVTGIVVPDCEEAARWLKEWIKPQDRVFMKASRAARFERILAYLEAHVRI